MGENRPVEVEVTHHAKVRLHVMGGFLTTVCVLEVHCDLCEEIAVRDKKLVLAYAIVNCPDAPRLLAKLNEKS